MLMTEYKLTVLAIKIYILIKIISKFQVKMKKQSVFFFLKSAKKEMILS